MLGSMLGSLDCRSLDYCLHKLLFLDGNSIAQNPVSHLNRESDMLTSFLRDPASECQESKTREVGSFIFSMERDILGKGARLGLI
jgi:hypothetical protein